MKCPEVVEWMHRYLDYDLSEEETVQLYDHLKQCPECAETFRMLKSLSRDLEDLPKVMPKFSIVDAIMPQLDAIDKARQEKSASREEPPAEMVPVPVRPVRTSKFRNSVAGRTAMGAAAAVVILGVAIFTYSPKHLPTAEEPSFESQKKMAETAASSNAGTQASGVQPNVEQKNAANDIQDGQESADGASSLESVPATSPDDAAAKKQPAKPAEPTSKPEDKAVTRSGGSSEPLKQTPDNSKTDSGTSKKASSNETTTLADGGGDSQDKTAADSGNTTETPETPETPASDLKNNIQDPGVKEDNPPMGIASIKNTPLQIKSPDGKYVVTVEENKLNIYSVSDKDGQKTATKTIDLPGTWVSGVWSADSTVFTYQTTDDQGVATSKTYQVSGSDASNP
ncbi:zf-HC2 domain-containing protein [Paenibacillus sp. KQZ6P-2]|uniref:Anti-sigma-W factor RsiW n=1 Tax=Paenibacillus mangrovi TaxID=2931978 RepID=A0A9X1WMY7_9BACL|nr:zf-HC2 domain-containing protein [Paenibacillus mangrovi]MCJ8011456.1 zf-HC2 domain-containing protein [Paenibacillus mangrovi]